MMHTFTIKNFKLFEELELSGLERITLLGGPNNIGKSTFLEAVYLNHDINNPLMFTQHLGFRGIVAFKVTAESLFAPLFHDFDTGRAIHLEAEAAKGAFGLQIRESGASGRRTAEITSSGELHNTAIGGAASQESLSGTAFEVEYYRNGKKVNTADAGMTREKDGTARVFLNLRETSEVPRTPTAAYIGTRSGSEPATDAERFGDLELEGKSESFLEALRIIYPGIRSIATIATVKVGAMLYADVGLDRKIPLSLLGDGTNRIAQIALAMGRAHGGVLLVDDIDSGLHHSVLPKIWEWLASATKLFDCQVIATTHSYECIRAAKEGLPPQLWNEFAYFRLDRENDTITSTRYSADNLGDAIDRDWEVR
ncbi:MAG: ATP-binding protein [Planctomycetes bacterium]|nr:ATP-binding protein [Planctomycetota bacterium]